MHRIYEWLRAVFQEKINIFIKGFFGGSILSGIFLFRGSIGDVSIFLFILKYILGLIGMSVSGIISGCASVIGNDLGKWVKARWKKFSVKRIENRKKKAA